MEKKLLISLKELKELRKQQAEEIGQFKVLEEKFKDLERRKKELLCQIGSTKEKYLSKLQEIAGKQKVSILRFAYEVIKFRRESRNDPTPIKNLRITNIGCIEIPTSIENAGIFKATYQPEGRRIHWKYVGEKYTALRRTELFKRLEQDYCDKKWNGIIMLNVILESGDDEVKLCVPYNIYEPLANGLNIIDYLTYLKVGFYPNMKGLKQNKFKICFDMNFERVPDLYVNLYHEQLDDYSISKIWILDENIEKACFKVFGDDLKYIMNE